jgi:hypothetical protein
VNTSDQQRFDAIRHRLGRASPGPWTVAYETEIVAGAGTPEEVVIADTDLYSVSHGQDCANAAFFAHAWDDIAWLTERVRDLERALKQRSSGTRDAPDGG